MTYHTLITAHGLAAQAAALASGTTPTLTHLAIGDANGTPYDPTETQTALHHERYRTPLESLTVDPDNPRLYTATARIPASVGGYTLHEAGLIDSTGQLFAIASLPPSYKPLPADGAYGDTLIRLQIATTNANALTLLIDGNVATASQTWVAAQIAALQAQIAAINATTAAGNLPIGVPVPWLGAESSIPANCLPFKGQLINRADYPALTAHALSCGILVPDAAWLTTPAHKTKFSLGDGSTTLRLPDLRGEILYGADLGRGIRAGAPGDWAPDDTRAHTHDGTATTAGAHAHTATTDTAGAHAHTGTTAQAGAHTHTGDTTPAPAHTHPGTMTVAPSSEGGDPMPRNPDGTATHTHTLNINPAGDHTHTLNTNPAGDHTHTTTVAPAAGHTHPLTIAASGGPETRPRGVGYIYIGRVL